MMANDFCWSTYDTIQTSPSHIYHSALPLSPPSSWLYKNYIAQASSVVKVVKGLSGGWGICSRTTLLGSEALTLSHHNNSIAAGSSSGDIIILNAITGSQSAVLSGHTGRVNCVVFSPDGTSLVSGGDDKTVKLWDVQTGGVVKTFFGHKDRVMSVSISADLATIASGSQDKTICLWSIQSGECYHTIQQQNAVYHVLFSLKDPQHLISISDGKVWQWDSNGCQIGSPFNGSHMLLSPQMALSLFHVMQKLSQSMIPALGQLSLSSRHLVIATGVASPLIISL
jgi:WD40 repeat protein